MKARHGLQFVSKVSREKADLLKEEWADKAISTTKEDDRAGNITYSFEGLGKITLSHTSGSMTIFTDHSQKDVEDFMVKWLSSDMQTFKENLRCTEFGAHFRKFHGTMPFIIKAKEPVTEIPGHISVRACKYGDVHFRVKAGDTTIVFPSNSTIGHLDATTDPKRKYLSDKEIMDFVKLRQTVKPADGRELGIDRSTFLRRLEKISSKYTEIERTSGYPAIYSYVGN